MQVRLVTFGVVEVDGRRYDHDVVVAGGRVSRRHKKASKPFRDRYGHTPLTTEEPLPWHCQRLIVGTGAYGALPVTEDVVAEARSRGVDLVLAPTEEACRLLCDADPRATAAVLHITC